MAEKTLPINPCCLLWQEEVSRLKGELSETKTKLNDSIKARKALRKGIRMLEPENQMLKKEYEEEKKQAEVREKEMSSLKSQIALLQQQAVSGAQDLNKDSRTEDAEQEIILLKSHISERDIEMTRLKESLQKENTRPYSEMTNTDNEMKKVDAEKCGAGRMHADNDIEEKEKDQAIRLGLETEISALKSQILLLQQENGAQNEKKEASLFEAQVSETEADINQLKKLLEKERIRADSAVKKEKAGVQKANEAQKIVETEKSRADEERRLASIERKRVEEARFQLERLRAEAEDLKIKLVSETLKFEETNKKLEAEKKKVITEKQRADNEMAKAEEKSRLLEMTKRDIVEEKSRADCLSQQLKEDRQSLGKLQKKIAEHASFTKNVKPPGDDSFNNAGLETGNLNSLPQLEIMNKESGVSKLVVDCVQCGQLSKKLKDVKKKAKREKKQADSEMRKAKEERKVAETYGRKAIVDEKQVKELAHELEDNRCKTEELKKAIQELMSRMLVNPLVNNSTNTDAQRFKLLKKELKIGKMQVKHAKEVASLEKSRNLLLQQEIWRIKKEFLRISDHLDSLDKCFSSQDVGINDLEKNCNVSRGRGLNLKRKFLDEEPCQKHSSTPLDA